MSIKFEQQNQIIERLNNSLKVSVLFSCNYSKLFNELGFKNIFLGIEIRKRKSHR